MRCAHTWRCDSVFFRCAHHCFSSIQIGGATGAIGDPSGRSSERTALSPSELAHNVSSITSQLREFFERAERYLSKRHEWFSSHSALERTEAVAGAGGRSGAGHQIGKELDVRVVNNLEWFGKMGVLDFLRVVGKHARVGTMMARDR